MAAPADRFQAPSVTHWFGTDNLGRDQLARITLGLRLSIMVALGAVALGLVVGVLLGLIAGYYGGAVDNIIRGIHDGFLAFLNMSEELERDYLYYYFLFSRQHLYPAGCRGRPS